MQKIVTYYGIDYYREQPIIIKDFKINILQPVDINFDIYPQDNDDEFSEEYTKFCCIKISDSGEEELTYYELLSGEIEGIFHETYFKYENEIVSLSIEKRAEELLNSFLSKVDIHLNEELLNESLNSFINTDPLYRFSKETDKFLYLKANDKLTESVIKYIENHSSITENIKLIVIDGKKYNKNSFLRIDQNISFLEIFQVADITEIGKLKTYIMIIIKLIHYIFHNILRIKSSIEKEVKKAEKNLQDSQKIVLLFKNADNELPESDKDFIKTNKNIEGSLIIFSTLKSSIISEFKNIDSVPRFSDYINFKLRPELIEGHYLYKYGILDFTLYEETHSRAKYNAHDYLLSLYDKEALTYDDCGEMDCIIEKTQKNYEGYKIKKAFSKEELSEEIHSFIFLLIAINILYKINTKNFNYNEHYVIGKKLESFDCKSKNKILSEFPDR